MSIQDKHFVVTEGHIKLLPHLWFDFNAYAEFGVPEVDPKRPYGNSDVYEDIAEILGIEPEDGECFTQAQEHYLYQILTEMTNVINITVRNNGVEVGTYTAPAYSQNWRRIDA